MNYPTTVYQLAKLNISLTTILNVIEQVLHVSYISGERISNLFLHKHHFRPLLQWVLDFLFPISDTDCNGFFKI